MKIVQLAKSHELFDTEPLQTSDYIICQEDQRSYFEVVRS